MINYGKYENVHHYLGHRSKCFDSRRLGVVLLGPEKREAQENAHDHAGGREFDDGGLFSGFPADDQEMNAGTGWKSKQLSVNLLSEL